ncbi:SMI1/KNR4 family protein [Pseudoduganella albidiflava]|nr:SMI1/KNR4 family protein [Pseudoduganella albidiflava]
MAPTRQPLVHLIHSSNMIDSFSRKSGNSSQYSSSLNENWAALEAWLGKNWPEGLQDLNPPASAEEIEALEAALGVRLPGDFVDFLKVHNGQKGNAGGLFDNSEFLSTGAILEQWTVWKDLLDSGEFQGIESDPASGIRSDWWHARWIPFTHNGGGDHYCLDLAPAPGGIDGQVITMWHDMGTREVEAAGIRPWFARYVDAVLAGKYAYSDDFGGLVDIDFT